MPKEISSKENNPIYKSFYRRGKRLFAQCRECFFERQPNTESCWANPRYPWANRRKASGQATPTPYRLADWQSEVWNSDSV
jgi:hypothetical protein